MASRAQAMKQLAALKSRAAKAGKIPELHARFRRRAAAARRTDAQLGAPMIAAKSTNPRTGMRRPGLTFGKRGSWQPTG